MSWTTHNKDVTFTIEVSNKVQAAIKKQKAKLCALNKNTTITQGESPVGSFGVNEKKTISTPFIFNMRGDGVKICEGAAVDLMEAMLIGNNMESFEMKSNNAGKDGQHWRG